MWDKIRAVALHRHRSFAVGLVLIFIALFLFWFDSIRLAYVPENFSYSAELRSVESTYNKENGRPTGGQLTYITHTLEPSREEDTTVYVKNKLDAATVDNQSLHSITREYGIDPQTGQNKRDGGYLFAPKNIHKGSSFQYRHVTYDATATMRYGGQERIFGLNTFRYGADYSQAGHLVKDIANPRLQAGQAEEYIPRLTLWIEPTTGWLIKYEEDTTIYTFNRDTGQRLSPVSHFTRMYTEESIKQHVNYARNLRYHILFGVETVPGIILLSLIMLVAILLLRLLGVNSIPVLASAVLALIVSAASLVGWTLNLESLMSLFSGSQVINPIVSLCFIIIAISTVLVYRRIHKLAITALGGLLIIFGGLGIMGVIGFVPFDIDLLLFPDRVLAIQDASPSARMALVQAFLFVIFGTLLTKGTLTREHATVKVATFTAGLIVVVGGIGLLVKGLILSDILATTFLSPMPPSTLALTVLSALALLRALLTLNTLSVTWHAMAKRLLQPALLCIPLVFIGIFAQIQQNNVTFQLRQAFTEQTDAINAAISDKVGSYTNALTGAQALFDASVEVTKEEWHSYITAIGLNKNYPGIENMGFVRLAPRSSLDPINQRSVLQQFGTAIVTYGQPTRGTTASEIGYNIFNDAVRTTALAEAAESGRPTLSEKIALPQADGHPPRDGFMLALPVFSNGRPVTTQAERQQALMGYVYLTFDTTVLINETHSALNRIDIDIYDGLRKDSAARLYGQEGQTYIPRLTRTDTLYLGEHTWTIHYKARPSFQLQSSEERRPSLILTLGSMIYLLVLLLTYWYHMYRVSQGKSGLTVRPRILKNKRSR